MMAAASTDWLWYGGGIALAIAGLALLVWALWWDRAKGRKRCPKCWYDMQGAEADESGAFCCPECGRAIRNERRLRRTRRRWRWTTVALVPFIGAAYLAVQPRVHRLGWWSLVSNRMLIAGLPFARDIDDFWCRELARRVQQGTGVRSLRLGRSKAAESMHLTRDDWRALFERCVKGDPLARPISEDWRRKYGPLIDFWNLRNYGRESKDGLAEQNILYELPARVDVNARGRWPAGVPLYLETRIASWWPNDTPMRATLTPLIEGQEVRQVRSRPTMFLLSAQEAGAARFSFDATLEYARWTPQSDAPRPEALVPLDLEAFEIEVEIVPSISECMGPVNSQELTDILANGLVFRPDSSMQGKVHKPDTNLLDVFATIAEPFRGIAIGGHFEVLRNGEVVLTHPLWWAAGPNQYYSGVNVITLNQDYRLIDPEMKARFSELPDLIRNSAPDDEWTVRLRSDPEIALRVLDCDRYWEGEVEIPIEIYEP
jgi:hypothetical protein